MDLNGPSPPQLCPVKFLFWCCRRATAPVPLSALRPRLAPRWLRPASATAPSRDDSSAAPTAPPTRSASPRLPPSTMPTTVVTVPSARPVQLAAPTDFLSSAPTRPACAALLPPSPPAAHQARPPKIFPTHSYSAARSSDALMRPARARPRRPPPTRLRWMRSAPTLP